MTTRATSLRIARGALESPAISDQAELLQGLRQGRVEALAAAFDRWHHRVRALARRLLSDVAAAEDLVQDVFTALPAASRRFRGDVDLERFLLGITVKRVKRHRRASARRHIALSRLNGEARSQLADPEHDAYRRQLGVRLGAMLEKLSLEQRVAFVLCEVEDLTATEAAAIVGVPEATVRTRLFHARRRLRAWLAEEHAE